MEGKTLSCAEWRSPKAGIKDHSLHWGLSRSVKPLLWSGTKEGRPDFWAWLIPVLDSEERAGPFTPAGLEYLCSSEEGIFWKRSYARSQCTPWIRTAVVGDNSRANTKTGNKGQCLASESVYFFWDWFLHMVRICFKTFWTSSSIWPCTAYRRCIL